MKSATRTIYNLWDARYYTDPEESMMLESCETLKEARAALADYTKGDAVIVRTIQSLQNGDWIDTSHKIFE
jgi:hypothetical protein